MAEHLTERQKKWFDTIRANLEAQTGRTLEDWVSVVRAEAPPGGHRAQVKWLKEAHGLGVNHASYILSQVIPSGPGWDDPEALKAQLWTDPASLKVLAALEAALSPIEGLVQGQRKGFTAWSRNVQFAAARPRKGGGAVLGLKLDPSHSARLGPPARREAWSERLSAVVELPDPAHVDAELIGLLTAASRNG